MDESQENCFSRWTCCNATGRNLSSLPEGRYTNRSKLRGETGEPERQEPHPMSTYWCSPVYIRRGWRPEPPLCGRIRPTSHNPSTTAARPPGTSLG